jgi:hypothetical protein
VVTGSPAACAEFQCSATNNPVREGPKLPQSDRPCQREQTRRQYKIVFADALQDKKHSGGATCIGNEVRPLGRDRKALARRQFYLFFGVLQKDAVEPANT